MSDHLIRINDFRLEVWETNKGHSLGLFKWRVSRLVRDLETWVTVDKYTRYLTYDQALREGEAALKNAREALWCPDCITVLEPFHRWNKPPKFKCPTCGYAEYPS